LWPADGERLTTSPAYVTFKKEEIQEQGTKTKREESEQVGSEDWYKGCFFDDCCGG
jgi:hypothetical protein